MSDEAIKKRQARAKDKAINILRQAGYEITYPHESQNCIIGIRRTEARIIRICINRIMPEDLRAARNICFPIEIFTCRETWCLVDDQFQINEVPSLQEEARNVVSNIEPPNPSLQWFHERRGYVYFLLNKNRNIIKIGRSKNVSTRINEIKRQWFDDLEELLILQVDEPLTREREIHKQFAHCRVRNEWFNYTDEIRKFIEEQKGKQNA